MIVHASTKLDISNYVGWLHKRLLDGFFDKEIDGAIINRIQLDNIEELNLYTKVPSIIYKNSDYFEKYNTKLITFITLYDEYYEPNIKDKPKIINDIRKCKRLFNGNNFFGYGPIFFTNNHNKNWHLIQFKFLCNALRGYVKGVYLDFDVNEYCQKSKKTNVYKLSEMEQKNIINDLKKIAKEYNIPVLLKKREEDFADNEIDVGLINCCPYACEYCKYITNKKAAKDKYEIFDQNNSLLYGIIAKNQKVIEKDFNSPLKKDEEFVQQDLFSFL